MKYLITFIILAALLVAPASALELSPPTVPESGAELMPERAETFGQGLMELLRDGIGVFLPNLAEAIRLCTSVCVTALLLSVVENISDGAKVPCQIAGVAAITGILLRDTTSLIRLGVLPYNIDVSNRCPCCGDEELYWSHRRTRGNRGVHAGMIMLKP